MCYQGNCVNAAPLFKNVSLGNPCNPNPCKNRGVCIFNSTTYSVYCKCQSGLNYTGIYASISII